MDPIPATAAAMNDPHLRDRRQAHQAFRACSGWLSLSAFVRGYRWGLARATFEFFIFSMLATPPLLVLAWIMIAQPRTGAGTFFPDYDAVRSLRSGLGMFFVSTLLFAFGGQVRPRYRRLRRQPWRLALAIGALPGMMVSLRPAHYRVRLAFLLAHWRANLTPLRLFMEDMRRRVASRALLGRPLSPGDQAMLALLLSWTADVGDMPLMEAVIRLAGFTDREVLLASLPRAKGEAWTYAFGATPLPPPTLLTD